MHLPHLEDDVRVRFADGSWEALVLVCLGIVKFCSGSSQTVSILGEFEVNNNWQLSPS